MVSAAEADYERNLANTVELISILTSDPEHGEQNKQLFNGWVETHTALCLEAANNLQPIWSQVRVKVASYADILAKSQEPDADDHVGDGLADAGGDRGIVRVKTLIATKTNGVGL